MLKLASERAPSAGDIGIQDHPCFPQHYMTQLMLPFTNYQAVSNIWKRERISAAKKCRPES